MTPEGEEKAEIKSYLNTIGAYHFWPVQSGYGRDTLDCLASVNGTFWGIEVKAPGAKPTKRQLIRMNEIEASGGRSVVGDARTIISIIKQFNAMRSRAVS